MRKMRRRSEEDQWSKNFGIRASTVATVGSEFRIVVEGPTLLTCMAENVPHDVCYGKAIAANCY